LAAAPATGPSAANSAQQEMNDLLSGAGDSASAGQGAAAPASASPSAAAPLDASSGPGAVAPGAPQVNVLREGTFIVNRVGKLSRTNDGQQMQFTFDSDGRTMKDPPLLILPNLKLMQMESAVTANSRDLRFRISGMITEYKSRNYVLLDKFVVVADMDTDF
jgi:hypothetical protein